MEQQSHPLILADGETVIKEYNYGRIKEKKLVDGAKTSASLIVTNKRIISAIGGNRGQSKKEIPINNVTGVFSKVKLPSLLAPIIMIILAVALIIVSIVLSAGAAVIGICAGIAFILVVVAVILLRRTGFDLVIDYAGGNQYEISWSNLKVKRRVTAVKVRVNRAVAYQIQAELGAIIINTQSNNK